MIEEIWKDIVGYEGLYQVSSLGNVKSLNYRGNKISKILKTSHDDKGYPIVCLSNNASKKTRRVHQLVAVSFLNHQPCGYKYIVNHIDYNKSNNMLHNLEIVTARQNTNKKHIKSSSKYTGVCWDKRQKSWIVSIHIEGKSRFLGYYKNEIEASKAYQKKLLTLNK